MSLESGGVAAVPPVSGVQRLVESRLPNRFEEADVEQLVRTITDQIMRGA
jgi:hypothetical protein